VGAEEFGDIKLKMGLFVAPNVAEIDFIPSTRGVKIVVHYVKELQNG
jgi:hypothetical protein